MTDQSLGAEFKNIEAALPVKGDCKYIRALDTDGNQSLIDKVSLMYTMISYHIPPGSEIQVSEGRIYGLYQIDLYSSGRVALIMADHWSTALLGQIGGDMNVDINSVVGVSVYRKDDGGIYVRNNRGTDIFIGFRQL